MSINDIYMYIYNDILVFFYWLYTTYLFDYLKGEILEALPIEIFRDKSFLEQVGFIIIMQSSSEK